MVLEAFPFASSFLYLMSDFFFLHLNNLTEYIFFFFCCKLLWIIFGSINNL